MAVVSTPLNSGLRIIVETGKDENNKSIYRTRSYNNVKTDAVDEDLMSVATSWRTFRFIRYMQSAGQWKVNLPRWSKGV